MYSLYLEMDLVPTKEIVFVSCFGAYLPVLVGKVLYVQNPVLLYPSLVSCFGHKVAFMVLLFLLLRLTVWIVWAGLSVDWLLPLCLCLPWFLSLWLFFIKMQWNLRSRSERGEGKP